MMERIKFKTLYCFKKINIDEPMNITPELQKLVDETMAYEPVVPEFDPRRTALFTSLGLETKLHLYKLSLYKYKIRLDCKWLLNNGYNVFVVSYGNAYGLVALKELIKLREQGNQFQLCCGKVIGEHAGLRRNGLKEIKLLISCDDWFGAHAANKFLKQVVMKVSIISSENFLFYSHQKVPRSLFDYYRKLVESWKKKELDYAKK